ncbi:MAG: hypothetical protein ACO23V_06220 [Chitinophagaceae bacterium]
MRITLILCFLFLGFLALAQPDPVGNFNKHVIEQWTEQYMQVSQYKVKGSPYLLGESFDGQITMKSGIQTKGQKILYNIYEQNAGVELNKKLISPDGDIVSFFIQLPEKFGGEKLDFLPVTAFPDAKQKGYYNILADGPKASFLRMYKTRLIPDPQNMYTKDFRIFEQYNEYYIFNKVTKEIHKIKLREKDVREALGNVKLPEGLELETLNGIKKAITESNTP